jgi:hypothetical protein
MGSHVMRAFFWLAARSRPWASHAALSQPSLARTALFVALRRGGVGDAANWLWRLRWLLRRCVCARELSALH